MNIAQHTTRRAHSPNKSAILLGLLTAGWIALLFIESSRPPAAIMNDIFGLDKIAHFFAFGVLGLLFYALIFQLRVKSSLSIILPFLLTVFVGGMEEGYQMFVPGRLGSMPDWLADCGGALFATILADRLTSSYRLRDRTASAN